MDGMLPYNGNHDNMIDRFDGRALLDFYREPLPIKRQKTADEQMLDEVRRMMTPKGSPLGFQYTSNVSTRI